MDPRGFEPPTPGLKGQCSNRAELWIHCPNKNNLFLNYLFEINYLEKSGRPSHPVILTG